VNFCKKLTMRFIPVLSFVAIGLLMAACGTNAAEKAPSPKASNSPLDLKWRSSFAVALQEARETKKPIIVGFFAGWCGPCKFFDRVIWTDDRIRLLSGEFILVRLDIDRSGKTLAEKYRVAPIPALVFLNASGKELKRTEGVPVDSKLALASSLSALAQVLAVQRGAAMKEASFATPHDAVLLAQLAALEAIQGNWDETNAFLSRAAAEDSGKRNAYILVAYHVVSTVSHGKERSHKGKS
jgi:thiol:disulfide interchange protein